MLLVTAACASQFATFHGSVHLESSLQIRRFESLEELERLQRDWEKLLDQIPTASIFNTWEWLAPWWRAYGANRQLLVLGFFRSDGTLVGLAPLSLIDREVVPGIRVRALELMGDGSEDSDNLDLLAIPGQESEVVRSLVAYLREHKSFWDVAQFNLLPSYTLTGAGLLRQLKELRWTLVQRQHPWCVLHLPETWDAYLSQVSRKERDNIRYYERRLARRCQVRFHKCTAVGELPTSLQTLFDLHQLRWQLRGEPGSFAWAERRQFYDEMARLFLARNWLEFWLLELDGKPAAAQFSFRYRDTVYALQQGFDVQHAALCVQDVLRAYVIRQVIAEGVRHYDFLGGVNVRKERWGPEVGNYIHIHFARPLSKGSLYLRTIHNAQQGKEWMRAHLPARGWSALRALNRMLHRSANSSRGTPPSPQSDAASGGESGKDSPEDQATSNGPI
jgi:CelD/BcsL family acetyltransferase involved in cellulose biosynthesis